MRCSCLSVMSAMAAIVAAGSAEWIVQTAQGPVRGSWDEAGHYSFRGIPYAEPPVGRYRYQNPRTPPVWEGIFNADRDNIFCPQIIGDDYVGGEDCLVLNVYTPETAPSVIDGLPVMVFVHGGAFTYGTSAYHGPRHLVPHGVILVTINYRTGVMGYLCLGDELSPGNAGMKDKVAALRWIKQNIAAFGGDPDNVTLFGHSSGGAAVDLLTLSPMADGLFKRAITQSGAAMAAWSINKDPIRHATIIAEAAGYVGGYSIQELMDFYMKDDLESIVRAMNSLTTTDTSLPYVPCLEVNNFGQETFITEMPSEIIKSGNYTPIPLIGGVAERERHDWDYMSEEALIDFASTLENYLPADLDFLTDEEKTKVAERLKTFYFSDPPTLEQYYIYSSDIYFYISGARTVQERARTSKEPVYFYELRYRSGNEAPASHGVELRFLISDNSNIFDDISDQKFSNKITKLWTNFAKFGNPTPERTELLPFKWSPVNEDQFNYLVMDEEFFLDQSPNDAALQLWNNIYEEFQAASL